MGDWAGEEEVRISRGRVRNRVQGFAASVRVRGWGEVVRVCSWAGEFGEVE